MYYESNTTNNRFKNRPDSNITRENAKACSTIQRDADSPILMAQNTQTILVCKTHKTGKTFIQCPQD
jgi:hypothetical protein